jgi:hypothetical protein
MMDDDGLTQPELSAYLRRLAELEISVQVGLASTECDRPFSHVGKSPVQAFIHGRGSALIALAELVERGEIRAGLLAEPIQRLHTPRLDASMPDD